MRNIGIVAQLHLGIATMFAQWNTKLTKFSIKGHPTLLEFTRIALKVLRLRAAYDTLMAAMVVAGIVS